MSLFIVEKTAAIIECAGRKRAPMIQVFTYTHRGFLRFKGFIFRSVPGAFSRMRLSVAECRTDGIAEYNIFIVERVKGYRACLRDIDRTVFIEHTLVYLYVDYLAYHAARLRVIALESALERDRQLLDQRCVYKLRALCVKARAGEFVGDIIAGNDAHIVACRHMLCISHADGESAARKNVLSRAVSGADAHRQLVFLADAAPCSIHSAGRAVLAVCGKDKYRLRIG